MQISHNRPPVYDKNSKILILGSFPSVKSRETEFFYGHPQNRFWRVISAVFGCDVPTSNEEKRNLLLKNGIALWDVVASCSIKGSADSKITHVVPNDISGILVTCDIKKIFVNGKTAQKLYDKHIQPVINRSAVYLPSTSPANAGWSFERLLSEWNRNIIE